MRRVKMIDCMIIGDSIAVGTHALRPECELVGKGGINTWQFNNTFNVELLNAKTVIISLGSNDHRYLKTNQELIKVRGRVHVDAKVYWILPAGNLKASEVDIENVQEMIRKLAKTMGDTVVEIKGLSPDGIHPSGAGYRQIVRDTR